MKLAEPANRSVRYCAIGLGFGAFVLLMLSACDSSAPNSSTPNLSTSGATVSPSKSHYTTLVLSWHSSARPLLIQTTSGFEYNVESLSLASFSFELIPCDLREFQQLFKQKKQQPANAASRFLPAFLIPRAYAEHPELTPQTRKVFPVFERDGKSTTWIHYQVPPIRYCRAHYQLKTVGTGISAGDDQHTPSQYSIDLRAKWRRTGETAYKPLLIQSSMPYGKVLTIEAGEQQFLGNGKLEITRNLKLAMEKLQPESMLADTAARVILQGLLEGTQLKLR